MFPRNTRPRDVEEASKKAVTRAYVCGEHLGFDVP